MAVIPLLSGPAQAGPDEGRDAVSFLRVGAPACPARSNSIRRIDGVKPPGVYGEVAARKGSRGVRLDFVGDYRTMAFIMSITYTPSVTPKGVTAPPTQGSH